MIWKMFRQSTAAGLALASSEPRPVAAKAPVAAPPKFVDSVPTQLHANVEPNGPDVPFFATYADIPAFTRVLSGGKDALFPLEKSAIGGLVAVEAHGRVALVLVASDKDVANTLVEALKGALRKANYSVGRVGKCPASVIAGIYAANERTQASTRTQGTNDHITLAHKILRYAAESRATDIHVEIKGTKGFVRCRIDSLVEPMRDESKGEYPADKLCDAMATLYNNEQARRSNSIPLWDRERDAFCMVPYDELHGQSYRLRFQSVKGHAGPKIVIRLLPVGLAQKKETFESLGFTKSQQAIWKAAMETCNGATIITGETGGGKSTSIKCFIECNPQRQNLAIYTIEEPVEYEIEGVHQYPFQRDLGDPDGASKAMSAVVAGHVRLDPDILVVGEIRDRITADALRQFVDSGHGGVGTLHARFISGITGRLEHPGIGIDREVLTYPSFVSLLVFQDLVPVLCPECCLIEEIAVKTIEAAHNHVEFLRALNLPRDNVRWKNPLGCPHCRGRGTVGKTVVAEMLSPEQEWLDAIRAGKDAAAIEIYRSMSDGDLTSENMDGKTVFEHALARVLRGQVELSVCARYEQLARFQKMFLKRKGR